MHTLKVGDILNSSWGYDQTNVTFYQVTRVTKSSVVLGTLRSVEDYDGQSMTGTKMPCPNEFANTKRFMRRVGLIGQGVKIDSFEYAHLWDGKPQRFSSYA